jgi:DNA processing protein
VPVKPVANPNPKAALLATPTITAAERRDWVRLIRSENVGPITFYQLLRRFGSASKAIDALPQLARRGGKNASLKICTAAEAEDEIAAHAKAGVKLLLSADAEYPQGLAQLDDAPPVLSVRGFTHLLNKPAVAIVGTRNASAAGRKLTEKIAQDLGAAGYVVTSGLARGIDTSAHQAALATGTIAVMAGGVDHIYPPENQALYDAIIASGAAISEIPLGTEPQARHFPRRNRLISGVSMGVLVVEAALKSGSLITANYALEQNREVFAIPGSPMDPRCQGTNSLIKQGAHLVESAADIIAELRQQQLPGVQSKKSDTFHLALAEVEGLDQQIAQASPKILELLSATPMPVDELVEMSGYSVPVVLNVLLELELAGRLLRFSGNKVALFFH